MKLLVLIDEHGNTIDSSEAAIETNYPAMGQDEYKDSIHGKSAISIKLKQSEIDKIDIEIDSILNLQDFSYIYC